jgi:hypothetical protein
MFLQIGGLWNLIRGITTASVATAEDYGDEDSIKGKLEFWYQWRNIEISATA